MPVAVMQEITPPPHKDPTIMNPAASRDHKAERYYGAARLCSEGQSVRFSDGSVWHESQLYAKAIELNPGFSAAYNNLALALQEGETICMHGVQWDKKQLLAKAIEHDPAFVPAYVNLAGVLGPDDRISVGAGPPLDRCLLLLQAIRLDPRCAMAYVNLGVSLQPGGTVQLPSGVIASPASLMAMAAHLDPSVALPAKKSTASPQWPPSVRTCPGPATRSSLQLSDTAHAGSDVAAAEAISSHPLPLPSLLGSVAGAKVVAHQQASKMG